MNAKAIVSVHLPTLSQDLRNRRKKQEHHTLLPTETEILSKLAIWAHRFSPLTAVDLPIGITQKNTSLLPIDSRYFGIHLDISNSKRLLGSNEQFIAKLNTYFNKAELNTRIAVSPTLGASWALSRYGKHKYSFASTENLRVKLSPLLIEALRIPNETSEVLRELNITTIGDLFKLPRKSLVLRFGSSLLTRIDQALGIQDEPLLTQQQPTYQQVRFNFDGPTTQLESLNTVCLQLLETLIERLQSSFKKVSCLILELERVGAPPISKQFSLSFSTIKKQRIWALLVNQLEQINLGLGVEAVSLKAVIVEPLRPQTINAFTGEAGDDQENEYLGELLDILAAHIGKESILKLEPHASYIPEKTFSYKTFIDSIGSNKRKNSTDNRKITNFITLDRPSLLLSKPREIHAMAALPDSPPHWVKWQGQIHQIAKSVGPERIAPEWWTENKSKEKQTRDYFKVQLPTGTWLWVFREMETSQWFVHGIWA